MRVFAVTRVKNLATGDKFHLAKTVVKALVHVVCDHRVVCRGVLVGFYHQISPKNSLLALVCVAYDVQNLVIIKRARDDINASEIFSRRAHHRRAADIDVFNDLIKVVGADRSLFKRI